MKNSISKERKIEFYKTKYRNIKDKFDEYDKLDTHDEEEIND